MRVKLCSLISAASLTIFAALAGTATAATAPTGPPTATGTGGAAATVETLATQAAVDTLRRGGNAVDAAVTAAAVLGVTEPFSCGIGGGGFLLLRTAGGAVTSIDHRETGPAAMRVDSFWENGAALPFTPARYSGLSVGVPGTVAGWAKALDRYGTISLAEALQPAIRIAREGFVIDSTFFDQTQGNVDFFDDVPASAALFLDPDGTPKDVGTVFRNADLATRVRADWEARREGLLPRRDRRRARRDRAETAGGADREPRVAAGPDDDARPTHVCGTRTSADAGVVPRARRLRDGAALERRLDRRRGAQHPGGLSARDGDPRAATAPVPGGVALRVRRPRRVPRRRGLRPRASARAALRRVRRDAPCPDHGDRRPRRRRRPATPGRSRMQSDFCSLARPSTRRASRRRTSASPTAGATSSRTRSRSSRPAGPGSSSPAGGSCSTTS